MSRSIGDDVATSVGVTWEPEIYECVLENEDCFLVLASDGVWEFIESAEVINMIGKHYEADTLEAACDELLKESHAKWTVEDDTVVDDITFIIVFFDHSSGENKVINVKLNNNNKK